MINESVLAKCEKVKVTKDKYGTYLSTTRNGYQWTTIDVSSELAADIISTLAYALHSGELVD